MENKKSNITKKTKKFPIAEGLIILVFSLLLFLIWFSYEKIETAANNFTSEKEKMALLKVQSVEIEHFKSKYAGQESELGKIDNMFVDSKNPLDFIKFLENTAETSKVGLEILPFAVDKGQGKTISFRIITTGSFLNSMDFLRKIEKGPYLVSVEKLAITKYTDPKKTLEKGAENIVKFDFSVKILVQ